jgi:rubrerythrin
LEVNTNDEKMNFKAMMALQLHLLWVRREIIPMIINQKNFEEIIRGERSAVETYRQVLEAADDKPELEAIRNMSTDHIQAVQYFSEIAHARGQEVPDSSGLWGSWVKFTTGVAKTFGDKSSLEVLKKGEEHGKKIYENILDSDNVDEQVKGAIRTRFLPQQERHIEVLGSLIKNA